MAQVLSELDLFAPPFLRAWNDIYYHRKETICCDGGRGSGKSTFVDTAVLLEMERDRRKALDAKKMGEKNWRRHLSHAACYRKVAATLADSCFSQLQWSAEKLGLADRYIFRKNPLSIIRKGTEQRIYFRGLDDPQKSRSIKPPFGWIKQLHFEELTEFDGIEEVQDVTRSIQRGGHEFLTYYSYNPPETSSNWVNSVLARLELEDPTFARYHSDYRCVPKHWLGEKFFRDAAIMRRMNERAYRHIYLGEITGNGGTVFPNVKAVRYSDADIRRFDNVRWGADFGLRDPTVLVGMHYDANAAKLCIFSEVYKSDMTLDQIEAEFKAIYFGDEFIYGDAAAGQLILSLRSRDLPILPAKKGGGSILNGIKGLQSLLSIEIDPIRCPNVYKEFIEYEYEKNAAGQFTGRLPDCNNHAIDSVRYGMERTFASNSPFN